MSNLMVEDVSRSTLRNISYGVDLKKWINDQIANGSIQVSGGDGNGIYSGSGTVPNGTIVTGFPRWDFNNNYRFLYSSGAPSTDFIGPYIIRNGIDQGGVPVFSIAGVRGTLNSPLSPQSGNPIGSFNFNSVVNGFLTSAASVSATASENWTPTAAGTRLIFSVIRSSTTSILPTLTLEPTLAIRMNDYGTGVKTASALSKSQSGLVATYATDGTILEGPRIFTGTGSPEGVTTAPVGSLYTRSDGGAGTTLYVKESGAGNTGWVAK